MRIYFIFGFARTENIFPLLSLRLPFSSSAFLGSGLLTIFTGSYTLLF